MRKNRTIPVLFVVFILLLVGIGANSNSDGDHQSSEDNSPKIAEASSSASPKKVVSHSKNKSSSQPNHSESNILKKLIAYTNKESAGPTDNYYWVNGKANVSGFKGFKANDYHFSADSEGRSATAKAVLTYSEYRSSEGSRQGDPLAPPGWPAYNPRVAIYYHLTDRTYHGYLYNRSHSIADSLLGTKSYTSQYNFTTGTRPQNVGADQDGGMRYAEEQAEDYWKDHPDTHATILYKTTPLYKGSEELPRGSVVDIKSSDDTLNLEVVVINSVEGIKINYQNGDSNAKPISITHSSSTHYSRRTHHSVASTATHSATTNGSWTIAPSGYVYVSASHKFYSEVKNPGNYHYMTESQAISQGDTRAIRGNQYAKP